ncbi:hypothetical protein Q0P11_14425, partial [Staphylococcus aureus]|nr:hypothetical protein [Staphylococcus aureus]
HWLAERVLFCSGWHHRYPDFHVLYAVLIARTEQNIEQRLPGSWPQAREKTLSAIAYAQAGLAAGCHEHISWVGRQIIPSTADEDELL